MIFLLWAILNIGLFLFFIFICFRATRLIREKLGLISSIIFVFGLLSFVGGSNSDTQKLGERFKFNFNKDKPRQVENTNIVTTTLDKNLIFKRVLLIQYSWANDSSSVVPVSAYSVMAGFVAGHRWQTSYVSANAEGTRIRYAVFGSIEWKLLGMTVYTQSKNYTGFIYTN